MPQLKKLKEEIKDEEILQGLTGALTEVSAGKIGVLKQKFEKNKSFYQEIDELYRLVRASSSPRTTASKGILSIAITTNNRFYGVINFEVMKKFLSETKDRQTDRLIVGKIGVMHLQSIEFKAPFKTMVFETDVPKMSGLEKLLELGQPYQKVLLYYPQFQTVYTQTPAVTDIAYSPTPRSLGEGGQRSPAEELRLTFEPELPKIVEFFETQIRAILLQRVLLEVELSITASRLQAMSRAKEHAREVLSQRRQELTKELHSRINARLLESLSRVKKMASEESEWS